VAPSLKPPAHDIPAALQVSDEAHAQISQRLMIARLVGKGSLGAGFIVAIFGVTNASPLATRTGLALLLVGIIATVTSFVHAFKRHRLRRSQSR